MYRLTCENIMKMYFTRLKYFSVHVVGMLHLYFEVKDILPCTNLRLFPRNLRFALRKDPDAYEFR